MRFGGHGCAKTEVLYATCSHYATCSYATCSHDACCTHRVPGDDRLGVEHAALPDGAAARCERVQQQRVAAYLHVGLDQAEPADDAAGAHTRAARHPGLGAEQRRQPDACAAQPPGDPMANLGPPDADGGPRVVDGGLPEQLGKADDGHAADMARASSVVDEEHLVVLGEGKPAAHVQLEHPKPQAARAV